ncbi:MAG: hydrogenase nickel incorporation protein HypB [Xanthobacteraceae bacterium]
MCTICGCHAATGEGPRNAPVDSRRPGRHGPGGEQGFIDGNPSRDGRHPDRHDPHDHRHHARPRGDHGAIDFGAGLAGVHVPGMSQERIIRIERDILSKNDAFARANRARLKAGGILALNLVSSPGSGKTSLLVRAIDDLKSRFPIAVIEGDQQTSNDADRIRATGAPAIQINTGKGCHLDAHMVGHALDRLPLAAGGLLFIENVGNLVCPAAFDLGEAHKVVVLSVTEGEDKPLKYPAMFEQADLMLLNKADLLPHLDFDVDACTEFARRVNPLIDILTLSARTGDGLTAFYRWIEQQVRSNMTAA